MYCIYTHWITWYVVTDIHVNEETVSKRRNTKAHVIFGKVVTKSVLST